MCGIWDEGGIVKWNYVIEFNLVLVDVLKLCDLGFFVIELKIENWK